MPLAPLLPDAAVPPDARCARHPEVKATATCSRCGAFGCSQDLRLLDLKTFCLDCAARPDVDYLEAYRLKYWGKRDSWAWIFGAGGVLNVVVALALVATALLRPERGVVDVLTALCILAVGANSLAFWAGRPFARVGLFVGIVLIGVVNAATAGPASAGPLIIPLIVAASVVASTRNRLFFKLAVSRADLKKAWDLFHNNAMARNAATLGVGGLLVPIFIPFAIVCGVIGYRRVDPTAYPPIGNKGRAIAGIALGIVGLLLWAGLGALWLGQQH